MHHSAPKGFASPNGVNVTLFNGLKNVYFYKGF